MTKRRLDFFYKCPILQFSVRVKILIWGKGGGATSNRFLFLLCDPSNSGGLRPPCNPVAAIKDDLTQLENRN